MSTPSKAAVEALKLAAKSKAGRKVFEQAALAAGALIAKTGNDRGGRWRADRKMRELAYKLARQVHGQLSDSVFLDSDRSHLVVWKDDVPIAAFPPVDGDLAERPELKHVSPADRFDPPPAKSKSARK